MGTVLLVLLILLLVGALPPVGLHGYGWGLPSVLGVVLVILLVLILAGRV